MKKFITVLTFLFLAACGSVNGSEVKGTNAPNMSQYYKALQQLKSIPDKTRISKEQMDNRISTCWKNPIAKDLTDLQKTVYCYFPLEFRLCNSPVLLLTKAEKDPNHEKRLKGYETCKNVTGFSQLLKSPDITKLYDELYLTPSDDIADAVKTDIMAKYSPVISSQPFTVLLARTEADLISHAALDFGARIKEAINGLLGIAGDIPANAGY